MGRIKTLSAAALLGFVVGVLVYLVAKPYLPKLRRILLKGLPAVIGADWFLAGVLGAITFVIALVVWAYTTGPEW
ncbi:hypothetical protein DRO48_02205 [Candidatus Bathyarchaeota archaeon]|nr:MAG: hypothetical protein DRO48_02205 [Candidatus Bathyarchaeota archaeon]